MKPLGTFNELDIEAAKVLNRRFMKEKPDKKIIEETIKLLTKPGNTTEIVLTEEEFHKILAESLANYTVAAGKKDMYSDGAVVMYEMVKTMMKNEKKYYDALMEKKFNIKQKAAGAGKTTNIEKVFDPTRDAYVVKFADVCTATHQKLKNIHPSAKIHAYTLDKVPQLKGMGTLYIDEANASSMNWLVITAAFVPHENIELLGDSIQGCNFNPLGLDTVVKSFFELFCPNSFEKAYYTFRFGPNLALILNHCGYPVVSLAKHDTKINVRALTSMDGNYEFPMLAARSVDVETFKEVASMKTIKSSQGRSIARHGVLMNNNTINDMAQYSSNLIVGLTRVEKELDLFVDYTNKERSTNFISIITNLSTVCGINIENKSDF